MSNTVFKAFATHDSLIKNRPGILNPLGELSQYALTYSREKGVYTDPNAYPSITLTAFTSAVDGERVEADPVLRANVFQIVGWLYAKAINVADRLETFDLLNALLENYSNIAINFNGGAIATDGTFYLPEWVSWTDKDSGTAVKIWFAESSFTRKYEDYSISVVQPFTTMDWFFLPGSEVNNRLNAITQTQVFSKIAETRGKEPETHLLPVTYQYFDPNKPERILDVTWFVLVYGEAGNNVDAIKDAIASTILANSTHTKEEWGAIIPDIFKRTEFTVIPDWANMAIPERINTVGVYSPVASLTRSLSLMKTFASDYPVPHMQSFGQVISHPYQSLQLTVIGSPDNKNNKYQVTEYFPDYISVSTSSTDFNRMNEVTRAWAEMLHQLILTAESMTPYSDLESGQTRLVRNGLLYVVQSYNNVHYLVLSKQSMLATPLL